jgi:hypothetical protein
LQRTDGAVDATFLGKTDIIYKGDRTKWLKFAYGLLGMTLNHYSNKSALYKPADVIAAIDKSFVGNADDALLAYTGVSNDDKNFIGNTRNNMGSYRQTAFIVNMMNGGAFGGVVDPRMSRILSPSTDGAYRGVVTSVGTGGFTTATVPLNIWGYAAVPATGTAVRYVFDDKSKLPIMTYSELQFIKAEAAFRSGQKTVALTAYTNGISSHIDFVNARNLDANQTPSQITAAEKSAYLTNVNIVPSSDALNLTKIMLQKYIALWGWCPVETWMDMRRFHYLDLDPATGAQVYVGYVFPTTLYVNNAGKPAYRIRPRYNSEYVWNAAGLDVIGGLALDYHTKPLWIVQP